MNENKFATFIDSIINFSNIYPEQNKRIAQAIAPETVLFEVTSAYNELIQKDEFVWSYDSDTPALPPYDDMFLQWDGKIIADALNCERWQGVLIQNIDKREYRAICFAHGIDYRLYISCHPYKLIFNDEGGFENVQKLREWDWQANQRQRDHAEFEMQRIAFEKTGDVLADDVIKSLVSQHMLNPMSREMQTACIATVIHALTLIHQRGDIEFVDYTRPERRRLKKTTNKNPSPYFRICPITPDTAQTRYENSQPTGRKNAVHTVRGHFRHYESGKITWVRSHLRGSKHQGISEKSYRIRLD